MTRVEWSALSGDDVEAVLSNLIYNRHSRALRIRPSQGDYGIDVIVPTETTPETWDVYQIKKFALNLTTGQKTQIKDSFKRILLALVRRDVPLNNWYLVTPLDPTLENLLDWFKQMPEEAIAELTADPKVALTDEEKATIRAWRNDPLRVIGWKGLNFCENLAADFPYVIDYYIHGGRERLRGATAEIAALLQRDHTLPMVTAERASGSSAALLEPGEVREHLARLHDVLDTDPHYRYAVSIDVHRPQLHPDPDLVAAVQESLRGDSWLTIKIYQRSPQSLDERPIPLSLNFDFSTSPTELESFRLWRRYGRPVELTGSFKTDLPGGLGRGATQARIQLAPTAAQMNRHRTRFRILDPEGEVLGELGFSMASTRGIDGTGAWSQGTDDSGLLSTEGFLDTTSADHRINFAFTALADHEASKATAAVTFASHLCRPNLLQIAGEYGPFHNLGPLPHDEPLLPPTVARIVQALATIQTRTMTPVLIPDFAALSEDDLKAIRRAAALIGGRTVVGTWSNMTIETAGHIGLDLQGHYQLAVTEPLVVSLNGVDLVLGSTDHKVLSARVESVEPGRTRIVPHLNDTIHSDFVPEAATSPTGRLPVRFRPSINITSVQQGQPST
jgi:hypothetical protein